MVVCVTPWAGDPMSTTGPSSSAQLSPAGKQPGPVGQVPEQPPEVGVTPYPDFSPTLLGSVHLHHPKLLMYPVPTQ